MIILRAKGIEFELTHITADAKPVWFLEISPHGKVPVLLVNDEVLFESNAIAEFLDEEVKPRLHPMDPIKRARNRAWTDFTPTISKSLGAVNYAESKVAQINAMDDAQLALAKLEDAIDKERGNAGPYFNGDSLSMVDAAYAPFFMRFTLIENICETGLMKNFLKVDSWRRALVDNDIVKDSVVSDFSKVFQLNLRKRKAYAAQLLDDAQAAE